MKIKFVEPSPKANQIEHVRPDTGRTLCSAGFAVEIPYASFRERLLEEGQGGANPQSTNPCVVGVEWGVKSASGSGFGVVAVIKRFGSETTYFSAPPADAPESIKRRFADLSNSTGSTAAADLDAAKRAQIEYNEKIKHVRRY
jgi:hypothetical protein